MNVSSGVVFVILSGLATSIAESDNANTIFGAEKCSEVKGIDNAVTCVAMSTLRRLEDLSVKENIEIMPGVVLSSDILKSERESRMIRTLEMPKNAEEKISKIFDMMLNVMSNLFTGRTLKIKMVENSANSVMRALEEGRGKIKKIFGPMMMGLGIKMIIIKIVLIGVALLASKALIISKIALVLALISGAGSILGGGGSGGGIFSKFGQGGGGGWNNYGGGHGGGHSGGHNYIGYGAPSWGQSWNTQTSQSYPYARSIEDPDDAQDLAYSSLKE